jgi:hypothetical protein
VYGGGFKGIMGVVSGAVLTGGGKVVGIIPRAMLAAGGEGKETEVSYSVGSFNQNGHQERVRKKLSCSFFFYLARGVRLKQRVPCFRDVERFNSDDPMIDPR